MKIETAKKAVDRLKEKYKNGIGSRSLQGPIDTPFLKAVDQLEGEDLAEGSQGIFFGKPSYAASQKVFKEAVRRYASTKISVIEEVIRQLLPMQEILILHHPNGREEITRGSVGFRIEEIWEGFNVTFTAIPFCEDDANKRSSQSGGSPSLEAEEAGDDQSHNP